MQVTPFDLNGPGWGGVSFMYSSRGGFEEELSVMIEKIERFGGWWLSLTVSQAGCACQACLSCDSVLTVWD